MENGLTLLIEGYQAQAKPPLILLEDITHKTVGALYLDKMRLDRVIISETNNTERYFLLANGVGIYFSFWIKVESENESK